MKGTRLYIIIISLFVFLVFLTELAAPKKFSWKPTYDKNDREPFGSYVFDDILSSSIDDYQVVDKTFFQLWEEDSTIAQKAFLLTEEKFDFVNTDIRHLLKLLRNGNQIMICINRSFGLKDSFFIDIEYKKYISTVENYLASNLKHKDTIYLGKNMHDYEQILAVYPFVHTSTVRLGKWDEFYVKDTTYFDKNKEDTLPYDSIKIDSTFTSEWHPMKSDSIDTLAFDRSGKNLAIRYRLGSGDLFVVSTPLMFTNFGILDEQNASYAFRLLSYMKGRPLIRIEAYGKHDKAPSTPLRYLLVTPPLRWAIYSTFLLILLLMIFTAKRRQRIIPVVETPPNRTLGFIELISSLFYSRHDNAEILKTKYAVFCSEMKQKTGVDLLDDKHDDSHFTRLAEKIGMPEDEIKPLIKEFRLIPFQYDMPDSQLKDLMDKINLIRQQTGIKT
ncbi:MAG: hypothetical protein LBN11_01415 [Tannerella sp.]|jgi:hypothetical protein|nr:hypothetical protein [Tannerella sp.]